MADRLVVHGANEAAAVETRFGGIATAAVRNAEKTDGRHDQVGGSFGDGLADLLELSDQAFVGEQAGKFVIGSVLLGGSLDGDGKQERRG
jgi:hypothetical protein